MKITTKKQSLMTKEICMSIVVLEGVMQYTKFTESYC
jgi:hypothetical protein